MKKIIFALVILIMFVSCSESSTSSESFENEKKYEGSELFDLELLSRSMYVDVFVDKNTGVLYTNKYTPIYNADGSLKNISQLE